MSNVSRADFAKIPWWERIPDLDAVEHREVEWLVDGFIPAGGFVLLVGTPASYKSWIALDVARAVAKGECFAGRRTVKREVLYVDRENPENLIAQRKELWSIEEVPGLRYWGRWHPIPFFGLQAKELRDYARQVRPLMIFDSLIRFHRSNENDNAEMARVMDGFVELARIGATVLLLHHAGKDFKGERKNFRGAMEIEAAPDIAYRADRSEGRVTLRAFKNRLAEEASFDLYFQRRDGFSAVPAPTPARLEGTA